MVYKLAVQNKKHWIRLNKHEIYRPRDSGRPIRRRGHHKGGMGMCQMDTLRFDDNSDCMAEKGLVKNPMAGCVQKKLKFRPFELAFTFCRVILI